MDEIKYKVSDIFREGMNVDEIPRTNAEIAAIVDLNIDTAKKIVSEKYKDPIDRANKLKEYLVYIKALEQFLQENKTKPTDLYKDALEKYKKIDPKPFDDMLKKIEADPAIDIEAKSYTSPRFALTAAYNKTIEKTSSIITTPLERLVKNWMPLRYKYYEFYANPENQKEFTELVDTMKEHELMQKIEKDKEDRAIMGIMQVLVQSSSDENMKKKAVDMLNQAMGEKVKIVPRGEVIQDDKTKIGGAGDNYNVFSTKPNERLIEIIVRDKNKEPVLDELAKLVTQELITKVTQLVNKDTAPESAVPEDEIKRMLENVVTKLPELTKEEQDEVLDVLHGMLEKVVEEIPKGEGVVMGERPQARQLTKEISQLVTQREFQQSGVVRRKNLTFVTEPTSRLALHPTPDEQLRTVPEPTLLPQIQALERISSTQRQSEASTSGPSLPAPPSGIPGQLPPTINLQSLNTQDKIIEVLQKIKNNGNMQGIITNINNNNYEGAIIGLGELPKTSPENNNAIQQIIIALEKLQHEQTSLGGPSQTIPGSPSSIKYLQTSQQLTGVLGAKPSSLLPPIQKPSTGAPASTSQYFALEQAEDVSKEDCDSRQTLKFSRTDLPQNLIYITKTKVYNYKKDTTTIYNKESETTNVPPELNTLIKVIHSPHVVLANVVTELFHTKYEYYKKYINDKQTVIAFCLNKIVYNTFPGESTILGQKKDTVIREYQTISSAATKLQTSLSSTTNPRYNIGTLGITNLSTPIQEDVRSLFLAANLLDKGGTSSLFLISTSPEVTEMLKLLTDYRIGLTPQERLTQIITPVKDSLIQIVNGKNTDLINAIFIEDSFIKQLLQTKQYTKPENLIGLTNAINDAYSKKVEESKVSPIQIARPEEVVLTGNLPGRRVSFAPGTLRGGAPPPNPQQPNPTPPPNPTDDIAALKTNLKKLSAIKQQYEEFKTLWNSYKNSTPRKEFKDLRVGILLEELLKELDKKSFESKQTIDATQRNIDSIKSQNIFNIYDFSSNTKLEQEANNYLQLERKKFNTKLNELYNSILTLNAKETVIENKKLETLKPFINKLETDGLIDNITDGIEEKKYFIEVKKEEGEGKNKFKLDTSQFKTVLDDIKNDYNKIPGYSVDEIIGRNKYYQDNSDKVKKAISEKSNALVKDLETLLNDMTSLSKRYAPVSQIIKKRVYEIFEPSKGEESKITVINDLKNVSSLMKADIETQKSLFQTQAAGITRDKNSNQRGGADEPENKDFAPIDKDLAKIENTLVSTDTDTSLSKLLKTFLNSLERSSDPTLSLTTPQGDSIFNTLFKNYLESKEDVNKGNFIAASELAEGLKVNDINPKDVLEINTQDKVIFIFVTLFFRLIALTIIDYLIDKSKLKQIHLAFGAYIGIYIGIFYLFLLIVNLDSYKLRIMFNYVNMHSNSSVAFVHPAMVGLFGLIIYYIMWNINGNTSTTASNDEDRVRLKYKMQVISLIVWMVLAILIFLM